MTRAVCTTICRECPFRKASPQGYLGESSYDPRGFISAHIVGEQLPLPCHMTINWRLPADQRAARMNEAPLCRGFLTMMRNMNMLPFDPDAAALVQALPKDESVFDHVRDFIGHHEDPERAWDFSEKAS